MNIEFSAVGEKCECKVTINVPFQGEVTWTFSHQHADKFYCGFATDAMRTQMHDALEQIRREAYEQGWAAAKAKKGGKKSWFSERW